MRAFVLFAFAACANAVVVDRIAVIAGDRAIKDSDIDRELRVVSFLNSEKAQATEATRREAAQRLIDQTIIRRDIELARYSEADPKEVDAMYRQVRGRYGTEAAYQAALKSAGITDQQLRNALKWQMDVLRFIEQRFRPATVVTPEQVRDYYRQHRSEFGTLTESEAQPRIMKILRGNEVNQEFYSWLDRSRKDLNIRYLEEGLR